MRHHGGLMRLRQRAPAGPSPDEEEEEEEDRWAEAVGTASTARTTISTYTVHDGALLDFSLLGGALHPDKRHIRAVYGEGITPDDILYGRVQPPEEFGPLYSTLRMLTAKTRQQLAAL
ncbi:hypothetical protein Vretimale_19933 [Volvox reticuliferus]|uniref:Ysc84 actin-binding domain-containing protein n=2 Tax=Volvox reticuliferus TaxID=1737510 RepID=A0A8J4H1I9_9CHLO|nr:hypothetical protein Vretimale_19933 [Volvox reticuliferus]